MHSFLIFSFFSCLLILSATFTAGHSVQNTPQQSLNDYVAFLNQSVDEVMNRFQLIQTYYADVKQYRNNPRQSLRLPSSGPLEEYYYQKALAADGLTPAEKQRLDESTKALWQVLTKLDQTSKALETYVRLNDYQRDNLKQSDALLNDLQKLFGQFSNDKTVFYKQIQRIYRRYQPYLPTDAYLFTEKEMEQVLQSQIQLLDSLSYYMDENGQSNWPVERVQKSMLADVKSLSTFGKAESVIGYPASSMLASFKEALQTIQDVKKRAVDDNTFAARQTTRHGNEVYLSLINHYNNDLRSWQQSFVDYSRTTKHLLAYPKFSPVFAFEAPQQQAEAVTRTAPFRDVPPAPFTIKPADKPADYATFRALTAYVEFINESLRQMNHLQLSLRNYQSTADYYRDPSPTSRRGNLTYSHDEYKVPISEFQLLQVESSHIPQPYRASINGQAEVLLSMLKEMDGLSIELIGYTSQKLYVQDHMQRSDAILDRYAYLIDAFDQKKEKLYQDVRRVHESYPLRNPSDSWQVAGKALQKTLDDDKEILFGVKAFMKGEAAQLPITDKLTADARKLIQDEYQNLAGLKRLGRNNGLCPYSPYEDIAENSLRFAEKSQVAKTKSSSYGAHPYEEFYYFFNNQLVYEYNKFSELAKSGVLKAVNQPNMFAFRRSTPTKSIPTQSEPENRSDNKPVAMTKPVSEPPVSVSVASTPTPTTNGTTILHDTVYVKQSTVDTVYIDRSGRQEYANSLKGFAANNMVLLLDVSASMDSPYKLPLLKKSIKSLLALLRPEDHISIVVYSGKARIALKPTSGSNIDEIAQVIDRLQSDGDTDGNGGIRLAYKVADKQYIRAGNNRIILATDGEFPISDETYQLVNESAGQDLYLTVFTFGRKEVKSNNLKKLASLGKGTYTHITQDNANGQLILEAQAKKVP
ncbi:VWA domain-containing protein [Spirosoma endbachense]|uniref:VWA domain-containing protein n=1 Tax=Spirosoma endbachense TaxID=2666025 RepID=A0A6P1VWR7_9BACT|nr:VWA domain-containing protein [Spirosoma endbachense]QHV97195.1 VWA domain-containing protein [Spirosoma endbachense]